MRIILLLLSILLTTSTNLSCSTSKSKSKKTNTSVQVEDSDEERIRAQDLRDELFIGRNMASQLVGTYGIFDEPTVHHYVQVLGLAIAKQHGRPDIQFHFSILDSEEINAYATPGGYIFITKGLLQMVKDESELASILAHEITHVNERHMYKDIKPKREVSMGENMTRILSKGGSDITSSLSKAVDQGLKMLLEKGLEHKYEFEADQYGVLLSSQMGYHPSSLVQVLERVQKIQTNNHMSKTHPSFLERIKAINKLIEDQNIEKILRADLNVLTFRFNQAMAPLTTL